MENWTDIGIILKIEKRGEKGNLLNIITNDHGRHMGWFNIFNKKQYSIQPGDLVSVSWSSRISNQLGFFKIELIKTTVGKILNDKTRLDIISSFCSLNSFILPEREKCSFFFQKSNAFLKEITSNPSNNEVLKLYVFWELDLLNEVGTPLNFSECTVSGDKKNLKFVSPKSGNAVGSSFAGKYENKLLKLPFFLGGVNVINNNEKDDICSGFRLTLFFIKKFLDTVNFNNLTQILFARIRLQNNLK